ncbi:MAG TPA: TPM domain-containing protein [Kiloniellaceae bacterium]
MAFLTDDEKRRLRQRIEAAERQTRGELVTVIARQSDAYLFIPLLWASLVALSIPPVVVLADLWIDLATVSTIQLATFLLLSLLFRWTPLKMRLTPKAIKLRRAARAAREQFLAQGVHNTSDRCGVLIYVSVAEHYVEILADRAIDAKVAQEEWDAIVAAFVTTVKQRRVAEGFEQAVDACGKLLAQHFPAAPGERNELPDHLIEL